MSAQEFRTNLQYIDDCRLVVFSGQIVMAEIEAGVQQNGQNVDVYFGNEREEDTVFCGFLVGFGFYFSFGRFVVEFIIKSNRR